MDPLEIEPFEVEAGILQRPKITRHFSYAPSRSCYKGPLKLCRLLLLMIVLPSLFIFVPLYLRYRVFSGQMYPMSMTDMRLIDSKISPTWCQRQVVKSNATFNAFVVPSQPELSDDLVPVSMSRQLELEDDMKEYWGFYLLKGSTVTVATCVRWPGASLIMIKGYKHLQDCAYIGDDSSEELDELLEAHKLGLLTNTTLLEKLMDMQKKDGKANDPGTMKRHKAGVSFHEPGNSGNVTDDGPTVDDIDHDPKELREILSRLHALRQAAKDEALRHYRPPDHLVALPALHRHRDTNVDKEERGFFAFKDIDGNNSEQISQEKSQIDDSKEKIIRLTLSDETLAIDKSYSNNGAVEYNNKLTISDKPHTITKEINKNNTVESTTVKLSQNIEAYETSTSKNIESHETTNKNIETTTNKAEQDTSSNNSEVNNELKEVIQNITEFEEKERNHAVMDIEKRNNEKSISETEEPNSREVFEDVLKRLQALGDRGKRVLKKLHETMGVEFKAVNKSDIMDAVTGSSEELDRLRNILVEAIDEEKTRHQRQQKRREALAAARAKRELMLGQIELQKQFNEDDEPRNLAAEELDPDGYADHHAWVNETTAFDMSNSEFWSSFSSSEEALLECEGLILNLPLTPHSMCQPGVNEEKALYAARANALTYRVPANGYYFFVFNSENEVQTNFIRARFDLQKTRYDVARTKLRECTNSTDRCDLSLDIFSSQKVVLEVPYRNNDSLWNEQFVIISECEPRTSIYLVCVIAVPIIILVFAFQ